MSLEILATDDDAQMYLSTTSSIYCMTLGSPTVSGFMVIGTVVKNRLLEVCLTQNRETMSLQMLMTVKFLYFIMYRGTRMNRNSLR